MSLMSSPWEQMFPAGYTVQQMNFRIRGHERDVLVVSDVRPYPALGGKTLCFHGTPLSLAFRICRTGFKAGIYLSMHPSIHLSMYPSIHPPIHLSIHPIIYLWQAQPLTWAKLAFSALQRRISPLICVWKVVLNMLVISARIRGVLNGSSLEALRHGV